MENRTEKKEALQTLVKFNDRLINNMKSLVKELREERLEDTDKLLNDVVDAINWEISVMGATMDLLNESEEQIQKEVFNEKIIALAKALQEKEDAKIADCIENLIYEFEVLGRASKEVVK